MQLKQLIHSLQSILGTHGNLDVVMPHPNADQGTSVGTPLFHLDILTFQALDPLVCAGMGSVGGLRQDIVNSPMPKVILRLTPYSMARVQNLHDMRNGLPVTPMAVDDAVNKVAVVPSDSNPEDQSHDNEGAPSAEPDQQPKGKIRKKKKTK